MKIGKADNGFDARYPTPEANGKNLITLGHIPIGGKYRDADAELVRKFKYRGFDLIKKNFVNIPIMNIIGNPPFYEAKPEGKKRAAAHLDIKIWDKVCRVFSDFDITFIMSHSCNQMKNHGFTAISE